MSIGAHIFANCHVAENGNTSTWYKLSFMELRFNIIYYIFYICIYHQIVIQEIRSRIFNIAENMSIYIFSMLTTACNSFLFFRIYFRMIYKIIFQWEFYWYKSGCWCAHLASHQSFYKDKLQWMNIKNKIKLCKKKGNKNTQLKLVTENRL